MAEQPCVIGKAITIRGNVTGNEPLIVEGRIEGTIALANHLTVEPDGVVEAEVQVEELTINGALSGDVQSTRRVAISSGAQVNGNLRAPRVVIEDGAHFNGRIEMDVDLPDGVGD